MSIYSAALTLIFVMDPLGNVPVFLSILSHVDKTRRTRIILRECLIAFFILLAFLCFGDDILYGLEITQQSLSIAGGIILFLIALKMIFPPEEYPKDKDRQKMEPFVVPLAIPMIAGPSAIATVMLLATQFSDHWSHSILSLLIASTVSTVVLLTATQLKRVLGQKGLIAIERLMGMILTAIAVQMFLNGIADYFHLSVSALPR